MGLIIYTLNAERSMQNA